MKIHHRALGVGDGVEQDSSVRAVFGDTAETTAALRLLEHQGRVRAPPT